MSRSRSITWSRTSSGIPRRTHSHRQNQKCPGHWCWCKARSTLRGSKRSFASARGPWTSTKGGKSFCVSEDGHDIAVGLVGSDLIAMGQADLVRRVIDMSQDGSGPEKTITANGEMMNLIRDSAGSTAWVVGQFDEISRRMRLPSAIAGQVPPIRLVAVKANINGGIKAAIRAEAGDEAAADQLRDVVRGFISLGRLQAGGKPELENLLKSIELSGSDTTVRLSFAVSPETLRVIAPSARGRGASRASESEPGK